MGGCRAPGELEGSYENEESYGNNKSTRKRKLQGDAFMENQSVRSVERAIDVLQAIKNNNGIAGVTEISQELGLAKSTIHRLLIALGNKGMVRKDPATELYSFGYKFLELALSGFHDKDMVRLVQPFLEELRARTGETAALAIKIGMHYTYISQEVSPNEHRVVVTLGRHYPLHWAATGKVLLAHCHPVEFDKFLDSGLISQSTERTVTDPEALKAQVDEIRKVGYATSFGERVIGSSAIAAPLLGRSGYAHAAIAIVGPESRLKYADVPALGLAAIEFSRTVEVVFRANSLDIELQPEPL